MSLFRLDRLLEALTSPQTMLWGIWGGFGALTIALLVLMQTRWGQSRPLRKCAVLSVVAHLLLLAYATTVNIVSGTSASDEQSVVIRDVSGVDDGDTQQDDQQAKVWESFVSHPMTDVHPVDLARISQDQQPQVEKGDSEDVDWTPSADSLLEKTTDNAVLPGQGSLEAPEVATTASSRGAEPIAAPEAQRRDDQIRPPVEQTPDRQGTASQSVQYPGPPTDSAIPSPLLEQPAALPRMENLAVTADPEDALRDDHDSYARSESPLGPDRLDQASSQPDASAPRRADDPTSLDRTVSAGSIAEVLDRGGQVGADLEAPQVATTNPPKLSYRRAGPPDFDVPSIYQLRVSPDRLQQAEQSGGSRETENAVKAALKWLADHQDPDGRWDASKFGAGREGRVDGQNRSGAGEFSDTAATGLALLAFLGAGHTHRSGDYPDVVANGLEFLLAAQAKDGNMAGQARMFAHMYCHGMATFALSEAFAMTRDPELEMPVRRAVGYTLWTQCPDGGWRYKRGDVRGDTSQLGWQMMVLKSAELAGIEIPQKTKEGIRRFLNSVSTGSSGGLASYRAGERISRTMTAEALICRQLTGMTSENPAAGEAGDYVLGQIPGEGTRNFYYWYYGTLSLHQLQGPRWQTWNTALRRELIQSQESQGDDTGSWAPDTVWGTYGGRVYTTAIGALCLEVYYRYLPLYIESATLPLPPRH